MSKGKSPDEIQINISTEKEVLRELNEAMTSGSYHALYAAAKKLANRQERLLDGHEILAEAFMDFHEIRNKEDHILLLSPGEVKIILVSVEQ